MNNTTSILNDYRDVLSVKDLIEILPVGKNNVYKLLNEHKIKNLRVGNKIMIPKIYLEEYLQSAN